MWRGAIDFQRVKEAMESRDHWSYFVFTYPHREWPNKDALFRFGVVSWSRLRKRLIREYGRIEYIQTWEIHKTGYPHVNVAVSNKHLWDSVTGEGWEEHRPEKWTLAIRECGFGKIWYASAVKSREKMAGYLLKKARELTGAGVKNQTPINAPPHFRRLRASQGLLPPPYKDEQLSGRLIKTDLLTTIKQLGYSLHDPDTNTGKSTHSDTD